MHKIPRYELFIYPAMPLFAAAAAAGAHSVQRCSLIDMAHDDLCVFAIILAQPLITGMYVCRPPWSSA